MTKIDLNADLGESFGPWRMGADKEMLEIVTSANVACGFHAGDPLHMARTVELCRARGVGIGAHPGFPDLQGFGRRPMLGLAREELAAMVTVQLGALEAIARAQGAHVRHLKLHGAMSNMACQDRDMARAAVQAVWQASPEVILMAVAGSELQRAAEELGGPWVSEVFADRTYTDDGHLTPRSQPNAMVHDADAAADNVLRMIEEQAITSANGKKIPAKVDTVCVHGDGPTAVAMAARLRVRLEAAGLSVARFEGQ